MSSRSDELRAALAVNEKTHDVIKRQIDQYIDREGEKAFKLWRQCQERHYKLSMDLQTEQVAFKLARTALEDSLVGTEDDVALLIQSMFQEAYEKSEAEGVAIDEAPCCTVHDDDIKLEEQPDDRTPYDPATMYPRADENTLDRIYNKVLKHIKRGDKRIAALQRNAKARQKWCEDMSAQLTAMDEQMQLMKGAREHWFGVLKSKLPTAQRPRFKLMLEEVHTRARKTVRGIKNKREADRNGVLALPPDGAITWMDHWAQVGMRANGAALRQSDYRMTSLEELYSSEGEQGPDQRADAPPVARRRTTSTSRPQRSANPVVDQAMLNHQIDRAVLVAKKKLFKHADERMKQLRTYLDKPHFALQSSKMINVNVLVEASKGSGGGPAAGNRDHEKLLGLGTPEVVYQWFLWGEMEDPPLPREKVQEIIDAYNQHLHKQFDELDEWMRIHCENSGGERKYVEPTAQVGLLNNRYSFNRKDWVFVWGATAKRYTGEEGNDIKSRPDLVKFDKDNHNIGNYTTEPWQYRIPRVFGIISRPTHGLSGLEMDDATVVEVLTDAEREAQKAAREAARQQANVAALQNLNDGYQEAKRKALEAEKKELERQRQIAKEKEERAAEELKTLRDQWLANDGPDSRDEAEKKLEALGETLWLRKQQREEERAQREAEDEELALQLEAEAEENRNVFAFDEELREVDEEERRERIAALKEEYQKLLEDMGALYTAWANSPDDTVGKAEAVQELDPSGDAISGAIAAFDADDEDQIHSALNEMREVHDRLSEELDQVSAGELFGEDDDSTGGGP